MNDPRTHVMLRLCDALPLWVLGVEGLHIRLMHLEHGLSVQVNNHAENQAMAAHLLWSWQKHPLDHRLCRLVTRLFAHASPHKASATLAANILNRSLVPHEYDAWRTQNRSDPQQAARNIAHHIKDDAHCCFWLNEALALCLDTAQEAYWDKALQALPQFPGVDILRRRMRAEWTIHAHLPRTADYAPQVDAELAALQDPSADIFALWCAEMQVESALRCQDTASACTVLEPLWRAHPWHPGLTLSLYELLHPKASCHRQLHDNPPAILLYSWNKTELLYRTLQSLRASDAAHTPVFVLDNGSESSPPGGDMYTMLQNEASTWPHAQFAITRLPVNIGAPAARNWLLSLPDVRRHQKAVFLDDDILLPEKWLEPLLAVAIDSQHTATVGCAIMDHTPPHAVQCADYYTIAPDLGQRSFTDLDEHIHIYCNAATNRSVLASTHTRPCLSVSGCCHIINMDSVEKCGAFDVRFSPSQFDDLERDIRCAQGGYYTIFTGSVRIAHMQHSSMRQATNPEKQGHIMGNKIKMEHLYPAATMQRIREHTLTAARNDLLRKHTALCDIYPVS